jgi:hypothetical protein
MFLVRYMHNATNAARNPDFSEEESETRPQTSEAEVGILV